MSKDKNAVGAVGTTGQFVGLIANLFVGFSVGVNVVVARCIGANDEEGTSRCVHTSIPVALILGVICSVCGILVARSVLAWMGVQGDVLELAVRYVCIYFLGTPFNALYLYLSSVCRANGDSKTPLYIGVFAGLLNVGLNALFILGFQLSVEGVAIATVLSQLFSAIVIFIKQVKVNDWTKISFRKIKVHIQSVKEIIAVGFPSAVQATISSLSIVIVQTGVLTVNKMYCFPDTDYQPVLAGVGVAQNLLSFLDTALNAISVGMIAVAAQNVGAKKWGRVYQSVLCASIMVLALGIPVGGGLILFREPLFALYGLGEGVSETLRGMAFDSALTLLICEGAFYCLCGFMYIGTGLLRSVGKSTTAMVIALVGAILFRILWILFIFPLKPTLVMAYACYPITWLLTTVVLAIVCSIVLSKKRKEQKDSEEEIKQDVNESINEETNVETNEETQDLSAIV